MTVLHPHHDGSPLHVSTSAPAPGEAVRLRLRVPPAYGPLAAVRVRSTVDSEPRWTDAADLGVAGGARWFEASLTADNPRSPYRWLLLHDDGRVEWLNQAGLHDTEPPDAQDFALVTTPAPPAWMNEAVMYQIFPDRFARSAQADTHPTPAWAIPAAWDDPVDQVPPGRSQQFYGGDLDGVVEHLDHLVELGVNLIYLTPVFPAESNHRYNASSFDHVDPLLGGDAALERLVRVAHERGIRVIGDLTSNHSGDEHEWFRTARADADAIERSFYYFTPDGSEYVSWLGYPTLPKFDWSSPELRLRFIEGERSVVARWLRPPFSLDGWRIDVANMTGRLGHVDLNAEVRGLLRETVHTTNPEAIIVGESTNDATADLQGDGWYGAMTYAAFTRPVWSWLADPELSRQGGIEDAARNGSWFFGQPVIGIPRYTARQVVDQLVSFTSGIPWRVRLGNMLALDSHDTGRFAGRATDGAVAVAVGLAMTLPGMPMVFAGDEFGEVGVDGEASRTPIPWRRVDEPAVAARLALYRDLIALRRAHGALATGGLRWLHVDDETLVFVRESAEECVLVVATRGDADVDLAAGAVAGAERAVELFGDATLAVAADGAVVVAAAGPAFAAWRLPGVVVPGAVGSAGVGSAGAGSVGAEAAGAVATGSAGAEAARAGGADVAGAS